jgi:hypothetical protein
MVQGKYQSALLLLVETIIFTVDYVAKSGFMILKLHN